MKSLSSIKEFIRLNELSPYIKKKQKGEVFTPYEIIETMLNKLEIIYYNKYKKNIFENEKLKWFDNSSGIGNFIIVIYYKLYNGLKNIIKNKEKRKKHILENMLYMSEIDIENINKLTKFINPDSKYKLNIHHGDTLNLNINKYWNISCIDIIIGNPPYQESNNKTNKAKGGLKEKLYIQFVKYSLNILKEDGYLVFIHPQNWRKINSKIFDTFINYNLEYIGLNYGGKLFKKVSVNTDIYVLRKNNIKNKTTIVDSFDNKNKLIISDTFEINSVDFIPKIFTSNIQSIIHKLNKYGENRKCIINSYCHKIRSHVSKINDNNKNEYIYPLYNTSGNPFNYYSSKKHIDQDKKKVIMSSSGKLSPFYDNGKYGTTQDSMYFIVNNDNEGNKLVEILNTKLYLFLIKICQWGNFRNEEKLLSYLKYPKINKKINDKYIYNFFKLTIDEINIINKLIN